MNSERRWAGDSQGYQKKYFYFQNSTKNCNKVGTIYKVGTLLYISAFLNCPSFVTILCRVLKIKIFFFYIPIYPLPIAVRNSQTNQFYQKKLMFSYIFKKREKVTSLSETLLYISVLPFFSIFLKIYRRCVLKMIFLKYPQLSPAHRRPEFIDQSILTTKK